MSSIGFRDSSVVIIETSRTVIRAGLGLHELLRAPSIEIPACVGLRVQHPSVEGNYSQRLSAGGSGEAGPSTSNSRAASAAPQLQSLKTTDYLVGPQLDDALAAGQEITVSWPFADGQISDFMQAEVLWYLRRVQNESPVLLSLFSGLPRDTYERTGQIFFERFNVAAFSILDRPMAQLYAVGALSGLVIDIGDTVTDVTPIYEGFPLAGARATARVGMRHCERYLAHLLRNNTSVTGVWQAGLVRVPVDGIAVREAEDEGVTDIAAVLVAGKEKAVIESGMKRRATAKASAAEQARAKEIEALISSRNLLNFGDGSPPDKHASPEGDGMSMTLQDVVGHAVRLTDVEQRQYIWLGLMVTGDVATYVKGIAPALQTHISSFILSNADQHNEVQPKHIRIVKVPEYFAEYREKGDGMAAFLGSSIVAKVTFHDGKNFISKTDYAERGPKSVLEMSASLF
ncbi:actin-like ATPase domain-containing protein [Lactifluus volemus]|nr:actin-like ATPase domain-containing protein [Lactifluus volemus]